MWLDGLSMARPLGREYALMFKEQHNFDDIINQFVWMEKYSSDIKRDSLSCTG